MTFLHKETTGTIQVLTQSGNKSSYVAGATITGHLKPYSVEDTTFDVSGITGEIYKFTAQGELLLKTADQVVIGSDTFKVRAFRVYNGITYKTTKILLVK